MKVNILRIIRTTLQTGVKNRCLGYNQPYYHFTLLYKVLIFGKLGQWVKLFRYFTKLLWVHIYVPSFNIYMEITIFLNTFVEERFVTKIYFSSYFMFHKKIPASIDNVYWQTARFKSFFWRKKNKKIQNKRFFSNGSPLCAT